MPRKTISISLDEEVLKEIKGEAERKGVSISGYISFVCSERIEQQKAVALMAEVMEKVKQEQEPVAG